MKKFIEIIELTSLENTDLKYTAKNLNEIKENV